MNGIRIISGFLAVAMVSGCASMDGAQGPGGPRLTGSGMATEYGQYAEVGVEFSSMGDFVALVSPKRWQSPVATGGSLSWVNPVAWSEDPGRTGRILLGEAVVVGGIAAASMAGGGSDGGEATSSGGGTASSGGTGGSSVVGDPVEIPFDGARPVRP
ncbi:hypothetical protein PDESU_03363 [Pontiella desulfatans]|uniref:Uncharacterized protein n=1 Tax=Pontiella desulfatans TaxID=2750659 RepID=A0A6C2U5U3_PONDE|nr:hypothetical protein [Pontiella desulfatans]VGO14794.1 hypothetical protein PDESU_03363 [Pontiella desulfatans]